MPHVKLLAINDVHICDNPPGRRVDGYKQHILDKLDECVDIAHDKGATHVLFLGDIFHVKSAHRVSHRLVQEVSAVLARFNLPVFILVGNHDITDGRLDTLDKQPLGVLRFVPNVTLLGTEPLEIDEDITIYPVPGTSPFTMSDFNISGDKKRDILAVHQSIVPNIESENEMLRDILFDAKEVAELTNIDIILYGHQHRPDGMYKITRDNGTSAVFSNLGSLCRLTISEEDVYKSPAVLVLDFADDEERTVTSEIVKITRVIAPEEAYKLEEHQEEKDHSRDIEETIKKLKAIEVTAVSIDSVISDVEKRKDLDAGVRTAALNLLEEVR